MRLHELLNEALPLSTAKEYTKNFVNRYEEIFNRYKKSWQKNNYRIYIPFEGKQLSNDDIVIPSEINAVLKQKNIKIEDYVLGYGIDEHRRKVKIGKILQDYPTILQKFVNDHQRKAGKNSKFYAVISRHPYDVAGMSTNRGWTSCLNLDGGVNADKVIDDVKEGTLVAYCVKENDKNINNPIGRVRIHPYFNKDKILFNREYCEYGSVPAEFLKEIDKWLNEVNQELNNYIGLFKKSINTYRDNADEVIIKLPHTLTQEIVDGLDDEIIEILILTQFDKIKQFLNNKILTTFLTQPSHNTLLKLKEIDDFNAFVSLLYKNKVDTSYIETMVYNMFNKWTDLSKYRFKIDTYDELIKWNKINDSSVALYTKQLNKEQVFEIFQNNVKSFPYMLVNYKNILVNDYTVEFITELEKNYESEMLQQLTLEQQETITSKIVESYPMYYPLLIYVDAGIVSEYISDDIKILKYIRDISQVDEDLLYYLIKKDVNNLQYVNRNLNITQQNAVLKAITSVFPNLLEIVNEKHHKVYNFIVNYPDLLYRVLIKEPRLQPYFKFYSFEYRSMEKGIIEYHIEDEKYDNILNLLMFIEDNNELIHRMRVDNDGDKCDYVITFTVLLEDVDGLDSINVVKKDEKDKIVVVSL